MGLEVNVTWGDSWRHSKEGLGRVIDDVAGRAPATRSSWSPGDPGLDIYIYVSGAIWQHGERDSIRLGTISDRGRNWLRVMIFVPDEITDEADAVEFFRETLDEVAARVRARLLKRRPSWPVDDLVREVLSLRP